MKKILTHLLALGIFGFVFAGGAYASEGMARLSPVSGTEPVCLANSVYIDGAYHLLVTCRGLLTPYSAEVTRYALWQYVPEQKKWMFVGKLNQGKFDGVAQGKFDELMITAEEKNSPRTPSQFVVAKGTVQPYAFDRAGGPIVTNTVMPTATPTPTPTVVSDGGQQGSVVSRVAGTILRLLVIAFVVVLVAVVVMTVITRRREMA